jgi:hypothetical protein
MGMTAFPPSGFSLTPPGINFPGQVNLPVSGSGRSYRAKLKSFLEDEELLSESSLHPTIVNGVVGVALAIPASLLDGQKHYVVDLYETNKAGRLEKARVFAFYVVKQQAAEP